MEEIKEVCDKCGYRAYYEVRGKGGSLFFCYHHYNLIKSSISTWAKNVTDQSHRLS